MRHFDLIHAAALGARALVRFACALVLAASSGASWGEELRPRVSLENQLLPFVEEFCVDCHNAENAEAGLSLERLTRTSQLNEHRKDWQKVVRRLTDGEMPPEDSSQPTAEQRETILTSIQSELDQFNCQGPHFPGRVTLHRLNRNEYRNTIADLLGVAFDPDETFPQDELGYGFKNNASALSLSPSLLEKYLDAAEQIATKAITPPEAVTQPRQIFLHGDLRGGENYRVSRSLASEGKIDTEVQFAQSGEHLLRVWAFASRSGDEPAKMNLQINGETIRMVEVLADPSDPQAYCALVHVQAGLGLAGVEYINDDWDPKNPDPELRDRNLYVVSLELVGPLEREAMQNNSPRKLLAAMPSTQQWQEGQNWQAPARQTLAELLGRAFRRPASDALVQRYLGLLDGSRERGESFERAMQLALEAMLISPDFLFREGNPSGGEPAGIRLLDDYELATRLSYFLWSTMPDEALFAEAEAGTLRKNLDAQCSRMLSDPRAETLVRNFGLQWLETPRLDALQPNKELFPEFDAELREAMHHETFLFLRNILLSDAPITTLLTADYSFLNQRLAQHYGIKGITGDDFRRVPLPASERIGLLTHASVLMVTSHADRTSPVNRGKWILDHLYNDPPPPPPAGVPALAKTQAEGEGQLTLREQLERHREDPSCAVCHQRMDQLGFALENFDPLGRWRERDERGPIDASGQLPDGRKFSGPAGLRKVLLQDIDSLRKAFAQRLLTYALGRGLRYYDACAIDQIVAISRDSGDSFSTMIKAIVHSAPFQQQAASNDPQ